MRLILTADLHYDHANSRASADDIISNINHTGADVLIVVGDAAASAKDGIEQCLSSFTHRGPKLFVPGNHELWTLEPDSYALFKKELPRRVRALGWHWLEDEPFVADRVAIVGTLGWYDYSFAQSDLGIPLRFYQAKVSPGAAGYFGQHSNLLNPSDDVSPKALEFAARWNDGRFVKLHRTDEEFLDELLIKLRAHLDIVSKRDDVDSILAAIHHLPFRELLPPSRSAQWDFTKAYLGSEKIGQLLLQYPRVSHVYCGHSHFGAQADIGHLRAVNIGSGYRHKAFKTIEIPGP
jgi:3',5'-cyclic AMP phosphodiesterase CpdA